MNSLTKYSIAHFVFPVKNIETFKDIKFIGILELNPRGMLITDFSQINEDIHLKNAILIESCLDICIGFPAENTSLKLCQKSIVI